MEVNKEALEIAKAYRSVFKSTKGREVLLDMAKNSSVFTGITELNPQTMAFKEGQRDIIFRIFSLLDMEYEEIVKLYHNEWEGEDYE